MHVTAAELLEQNGTRATTDMGMGPDYGPFHYYKLSEPFLSEELKRMANGRVGGRVDSISFQPCLSQDQRSQDRYVVEEWDLPGGNWTLSAVFDGHAGHETVDYASTHLPGMIKAALASALGGVSGLPISPEVVSDVLSTTIKALDDSFADDLFAIFPGGPAALETLSDAEIRAVIGSSGENIAKLLRCMRGSTALISLVDPAHENLWVASLGDCTAVLGTTSASGTSEVKVLSVDHNGQDKIEAARIRREHPGEQECILKNRVLGAIAVTRALGDHLFKLPAIYTSRVFLNSPLSFRFSTPLTDFLPRNRTPPYLSNVPDVVHVQLECDPDAHLSGAAEERFLILASDGLMDLYIHSKQPLVRDAALLRWVSVVGEGFRVGKDAEGNERPNVALRLLRDALGGEDAEAVSCALTVEMEHRWMDDTTVLVQRL